MQDKPSPLELEIYHLTDMLELTLEKFLATNPPPDKLNKILELFDTFLSKL